MKVHFLLSSVWLFVRVPYFQGDIPIILIQRGRINGGAAIRVICFVLSSGYHGSISCLFALLGDPPVRVTWYCLLNAQRTTQRVQRQGTALFAKLPFYKMASSFKVSRSLRQLTLFIGALCNGGAPGGACLQNNGTCTLILQVTRNHRRAPSGPFMLLQNRYHFNGRAKCFTRRRQVHPIIRYARPRSLLQATQICGAKFFNYRTISVPTAYNNGRRCREGYGWSLFLRRPAYSCSIFSLAFPDRQLRIIRSTAYTPLITSSKGENFLSLLVKLGVLVLVPSRLRVRRGWV